MVAMASMHLAGLGPAACRPAGSASSSPSLIPNTERGHGKEVVASRSCGARLPHEAMQESGLLAEAACACPWDWARENQ
jgi:hypothetical protein